MPKRLNTCLIVRFSSANAAEEGSVIKLAGPNGSLGVDKGVGDGEGVRDGPAAIIGGVAVDCGGDCCSGSAI